MITNPAVAGRRLHVEIARGFTTTSRKHLLAIMLVGGMAYGLVMGGYAGLDTDGLVRILFSALKVPILLLVTLLISLPSFLVLNVLAGLRSDVAEVLRSILGAQALLAVMLACLSPYTILWYASFPEYSGAQLFCLVSFSVASLVAQQLLRRHYRVMIARDRRHRTMLWTWLLIYSVVATQMAWVLRPFVGKPGAPVELFRHDSWGNAFEVVAELIWKAIS